MRKITSAQELLSFSVCGCSYWLGLSSLVQGLLLSQFTTRCADAAGSCWRAGDVQHLAARWTARWPAAVTCRVVLRISGCGDELACRSPCAVCCGGGAGLAGGGVSRSLVRRCAAKHQVGAGGGIALQGLAGGGAEADAAGLTGHRVGVVVPAALVGPAGVHASDVADLPGHALAGDGQVDLGVVDGTGAWLRARDVELAGQRQVAHLLQRLVQAGDDVLGAVDHDRRGGAAGSGQTVQVVRPLMRSASLSTPTTYVGNSGVPGQRSPVRPSPPGDRRASRFRGGLASVTRTRAAGARARHDRALAQIRQAALHRRRQRRGESALHVGQVQRLQERLGAAWQIGDGHNRGFDTSSGQQLGPGKLHLPSTGSHLPSAVASGQGMPT